MENDVKKAAENWVRENAQEVGDRDTDYEDDLEFTFESAVAWGRADALDRLTSKEFLQWARTRLPFEVADWLEKQWTKEGKSPG